MVPPEPGIELWECRRRAARARSHRDGRRPALEAASVETSHRDVAIAAAFADALELLLIEFAATHQQSSGASGTIRVVSRSRASEGRQTKLRLAPRALTTAASVVHPRNDVVRYPR